MFTKDPPSDLPPSRPTRRRTVAALALLAVPTTRGVAKSDRTDRRADARAPWTTLPPTPALPETGHRGLAEVNDTSVFYARFGEGPPVLLLHGGMGSSNYWGHQVEHLARDHTVIVMDTRGHGRSPVTSRAFSYALFAQDAVALLDFLAIPKAAVVGWSDGAVTGLQLAMKHPECVSRLFAFGGNSSLDGMIPNGAQARTFVAYGNRCKSEYAALSAHPERWPQLVSGLRAMWRSEPNFSDHELAGVKAIATISDGAYDEIIKRNHTEHMAHAIPRAQLAILPRVSHFAMLQDPGRFNAALDAFLKE